MVIRCINLKNGDVGDYAIESNVEVFLQNAGISNANSELFRQKLRILSLGDAMRIGDKVLLIATSGKCYYEIE